MKRFMIALVCAMCALADTGFSAAPSSMSLQGRLTDVAGVPLSGLKSFEFRIFDADNLGVQVWPTLGAEIQNLTADSDGLWSATVGRFVSLTDAVFSDTIRWLQVTVDGTTLPRVRLVTGPYANRVSTVDGASGGTITSKLAIGPGHSNLGQDVFVAGSGNTVGGDFSAVGGGAGNSANGFYATVNGGLSNAANGTASSVGGGTSNTASGSASTVSGGEQNSTLGSFTGTIGGGAWNRVSSNYGTVGGGLFDTASGAHATVAGGRENHAAGANSTVGGGLNNRATGDWSFIGGGHDNSAEGDSSFIVGGTHNRASGRGAVVVGGSENHARGAFSFVGGGGGMFADSNTAIGDYSVVVGGHHATASGTYSFVGGGVNNRALSHHDFVGGGEQNHVEGNHSAIVGGSHNNLPEASYSFIGGGRRNTATGDFSAVVGGDSNLAQSAGVFIGGGKNNHAFGTYAAILGGQRNSVDGIEATCIGGRNDTIRGDLSAGLGGYRNFTGTLAKYSVVAGKRARANHAGSFVWADSTDADFTSTGVNQFLIRAAGGVGVGTADPEGPLHVQNGSAGTVTANANSAAVFESSTATWVSILGPSSSEKGILFSDPGLSIAGGIVFDHGGGGNDMAFRTGGNVTHMVLDGVGNLDVTGNITATGTCCASDARFKCEIETLPNALDAVGKLRGVTYKWRTSEFPDRRFADGEQVGLIAQEVREVVPQAVIEQSDGYLAVDYARLVPLLIEGMKEQRRHIDKQNERIASLEKKLEQ